MKRFLTILVLTFISTNIIAQEAYIVDLDSRNKAIELMNEAVNLIGEEKADEAVDLLVRAIDLDSIIRNIYLNLYQAGKNTEKYEIVIQGLNKGKRIFQEDDELHFYCAEIHKLNHDLDSALIEYDNAIKYSKKNGEDYYLVPYYYLSRGNYYFKMKNFEKALIDYNYLLKLKPDVSGLTNRGVCLFRLGRNTEACEDWNTAKNKGYNPAKSYYDKYCQ